MAATIEQYATECIEALDEKQKAEEEPPTPTIANESSDDEGESMTAAVLNKILGQDEITDEDKERLKIYLRKKKNKRKRNLLREI